MVAFNEKQEIIPSQDDARAILIGSITKTLRELNMVPSQIILVKDGDRSKDFRRQFLPEYKTRDKGPPEFYEEFLSLLQFTEDTLLSYGAISVEKRHVEADDIIAALAEVMPDSVIWSGDKDLLAANCDLYFSGELNPDKFFGVSKKGITVYKALVGDKVDTVKGAKGYGESAFIDMITKYGDDSLDDMYDMLENKTLHELAPYAEDFKPFQKILADVENVYACFQCVKFHHPGFQDLKWKARYPKGNGTFPQWDLEIKLITASMLTPEFLKKFRQELKDTPGYIGFDIETWQDAESLAWGWANKSKQSKGPKLDVYGSHMAGFSITAGVNSRTCYYFPVDHAETDNIELDDMTMLLNMVPDDKHLVVWNAAFELPIVRKHCELRFDRGWLPNVLDTLIMHSYVNENETHKLKTNTKAWLDYDQVIYDEVTASPGSGTFDSDADEDSEGGEDEEVLSRQMNELTGKEVVAYGCDDSIVTLALANLFEVIMKYEGTYRAFMMCEPDPAYLVAEAFLNGQKFDLERLAELDKANAEEFEKLMVEIKAKLIDLEWQEGDPKDGVTWTCRMPGCVFEPALSFTGAEIKKVYKQVTGDDLKTTVRTPEKVLGLIGGEFASVKTVEELNSLGASMFKPDPQLNLGSPTQMGVLLYEAMGFPVRLRGKLTDKMRAKGQTQGNRKSNESAIRHAIMYDASEEQKELLLLLIKAKGLVTDRSLYLTPYPAMPNPKSGMVHPNPGQSRTKTRRFAPSGPNVGQVSKKSPIREVYAAPEPGMVCWSLDFSGQELRITAHRSQCEVMSACYPKGGKSTDVHSIVGIKVAEELEGLHYEYDEFVDIINSDDHPDKKKLKEFRAAGKRQVFGSVYGQTEIGLAEKLLVTVERARQIVAANDAAFPGVARWKEETSKRLQENGYGTTLLGARRHLILDGSWKDQHELRSGINSEVQGPAAEQTKLVMAEMWRNRIFDRYDATFSFPVHDQVVGFVSKNDAVEFIREAHRIMTMPFADMDIDVESSIDIGINFGKLTELGAEFSEEKILEELNKY